MIPRGIYLNLVEISFGPLSGYGVLLGLMAEPAWFRHLGPSSGHVFEWIESTRIKCGFNIFSPHKGFYLEVER